MSMVARANPGHTDRMIRPEIPADLHEATAKGEVHPSLVDERLELERKRERNGRIWVAACGQRFGPEDYR